MFVEQTQIAKMRGKRNPLNMEWPRMFLPNKLKLYSCNELVEHKYALHKYKITKKQGRILAAITAHLQGASRPQGKDSFF